ncbi:MAG: hypothetical protein A2Y69_06830 [Candidatus Aminicenantes bacterium RBG_13_59_9]|nr:MAG: hypothetical protein A2Y69_06830 [Candidatus Aminicenantes bacterium RBG_13_59_9]
MKKALSAIAIVAILAAVPAAAFEDAAASTQPTSEQAAQKAAQTAGIKVAVSLLDKLTGTFKEMAETGTGDRAVLEKAMQEIITEARQARAQKQVDAVFFFKFNRLITIIQLAIVEDPKGILAPLVDREVGDFIEEVTGERIVLPSKGGKGVGIGLIAGALADEILNLRIYLETLPRREALIQEFYGQFSQPKK